MNARRKLNRNGAAAMEFALVAPIFFLFVLGVFEFGRGQMVQQVLTNTARQACRAAILPGASTSVIQSLVNATLAGQGFHGATTTVYVNDAVSDPKTATSTDKITVVITIPVAQISVVPKGFMSGNLTAQWTLRRV